MQPDLEIGSGERGNSNVLGPSSYQVRVIGPFPEQLVEAFHLRYAVYQPLGYIVSSPVELDVDAYDVGALPLGVFDAGARELVGTMRVIRTEPWPDYRRAVERVVAEAGDTGLMERVLERSAILPSITSPSVAQMLAVIAGGLPIFEMSRLIVRPDCRGKGLTRLLIEAGMALAWSEGPALLIGGCLGEHVSMYARYGFRSLRHDSREDYFASVGRVAHVLVCCPEDVPELKRSHIQWMTQHLAKGECHAQRAAPGTGCECA